MTLLLFQDRTEKELENRLIQYGFSAEAITGAMEYVKHNGYIDDTRYADNYITLKKAYKSKREICYKLKQKGISSDIVQEAFDEFYSDDIALQNTIMLRSRSRKMNLSKEDDRQRLIAHLTRRGFDISDILRNVENCN
ncbi:MAG: recombination regulator RecX [Lachnoclostridium sp.]|nr:recombination regulator RecX [Lachnoclostridium sp.]